MPTRYSHTIAFRPVPNFPHKPCKHYLEHRQELEAMDDILTRSGLDEFMLQRAQQEFLYWRRSSGTLLLSLNQLLIEFGNARRRKDSKRLRKQILRELKHFAERCAHHARGHRKLLIDYREEKTKLSEGQANLLIRNLDNILTQLPVIKKTSPRPDHRRQKNQAGRENPQPLRARHQSDPAGQK